MNVDNYFVFNKCSIFLGNILTYYRKLGSLLSNHFFPFQSDSRSSLNMAGWGCLMEQMFLFLIAQLLPLCLLTCSFSFPGEFLSLGESPHLCWIFQKFYISLESLNWDPSMKIAWENYMDVKQWKDATAFSTSILPSCFCPLAISEVV